MILSLTEAIWVQLNFASLTDRTRIITSDENIREGIQES